MELIERYLQAVGRALPGSQREDILAELRTALYDSLDGEEKPSEQSVVELLKKMGPPQKVAASYYPVGQYLIGPALYPLFKMVLWIVLAAVTGAQLLAILLTLVLGARPLEFSATFGGIFNSLLPAFGSVVLIFWILQRREVKPAMDETFDPRALPPLEGEGKPVSRTEKVVSIIFGVGFLAFFASLVQNGTFDQGFFANPVILAYFPWIALSMALTITVDVLLLMQGRWQFVTRLIDLGANLFSLWVLGLVIQGQQALLAAAGLASPLDTLKTLEHLSNTSPTFNLVGMSFFQFALAIAFIVTAIETLVQAPRLFRSLLQGESSSAPSLTRVKR